MVEYLPSKYKILVPPKKFKYLDNSCHNYTCGDLGTNSK
jgi:hypothetical protein